MTNPFLQQLASAASGLLFLSETDAPFEAVALPDAASTEESVRRHLAIAQGTPVEILSPEQFFRNQLREDRPDAPRFNNLLQIIQNTIPDARVYRFGAIRIDVVIAGTFADGTRGGLRTLVVET